MRLPVQAWQRPQCTSSGFEYAEKHRASWKMQRRWVSWVSEHALAKDATNSCKLGMYACKSWKPNGYVDLGPKPWHYHLYSDYQIGPLAVSGNCSSGEAVLGRWVWHPAGCLWHTLGPIDEERRGYGDVTPTSSSSILCHGYWCWCLSQISTGSVWWFACCLGLFFWAGGFGRGTNWIQLVPPK